jgi:hypothetical protein
LRVAGLLLLVLAALSGAAQARAGADADEVTWMKVSLDGRKIGQLMTRRAIGADGLVTTTEQMAISLDRAGVTLDLETEETSVETAAGEPLAFSSVTAMAGTLTRVDGRIDGGTLHVTEAGAAGKRERSLAWPTGALLAEGLRLAERRAGLAPGTRYEVIAWETSAQAPLPVAVSVHAAGDDAPADTVRIEQRIDFGGSAMTMQAWVDQEFKLQRASLPMLGIELVMTACPESCARAPNQPSDILERALVSAPRALTDAERAAGLRYTLTLTGDSLPALPDHPGQDVQGRGPTVIVDVDPAAGGDTTRPTARDRGPNRWLESDDAEVLAFARAAVPERGDVHADMQAIERAVRAHISDKSMRVGYASAAETVRAREGDCTEHALLLAAAGRALGIPTRVVNGLAYAPSFSGREHVFVPHAWAQAWDGTRWRDYDAALSGHDAGHIALSVGDGDSAGFYAGVMLLGNVRIDAIEPLAEAER